MRLLRGAPGAGKTALVFREFKEALARGGAETRIVVPTATLVRHFQHELARDGVVFSPSSVVSLRRFVADRASPLKAAPVKAAPVKAAPDGLVRLIVRRTLRDLELPEFAGVAETNGMAATVLETISLFENAGCTPDRLASVRKLHPHARAFGKIWRTVEEELRRRGYTSRSGMLQAAALNIKRERIWMDGFINISPAEKELVRALSRTCDLTLTVIDAPAGDELRRMALEFGAAERLLQGSSRKPPVTVVTATSMEREADEIARRVLELHGGGLGFREMAVAIRDARSYLPLIRSTFERFGIPARFYFSEPLKSHPVARFFGGLIDCALGGWEFGAALDALRAHPGWGPSAAFDRFDFDVREKMPGRGLQSLKALCEADLAQRIEGCFAVDAWRNETLRPAQWARRFEKWMDALYRPGMLETARDFSAVETARSHVAALRALSEALGHAVDLLGAASEPIGLEKFWRAASEAIDGATVQIPDDRRDVVHVINVFEARQWDVAALFVCGLTDRDYPKKNPQNLLFPDSDIDALHKAGIPLRKATDQDREETALFESLRSRARQSLVLTYPLHNASGASAESSRLLTELHLTSTPAALCRATPAGSSLGAGLPGRLNSQTLLAALADRHRNVGISALEDLSQCRFKFFAGRTLGLKGRPERPQERLQPRVNGLILHQALEEWLKAGRAGEFAGAFEMAFEDACRERNLPPGYRLEMERIFLRGIARGVSATERWSHVSSEAEVSLSLNFPDGVTVHGRVDRIDRLNERDCVIVDYKSGAVPGIRQLIDSPVKLQGPLYALAARERLHLNTVAMMYVAVREDKPYGWGSVPGVELGLAPIPPGWIENARERAIERLGSLLSGAIHADPVEVDKCRWCDFVHACRFGSEAAKVEAAHGD
jgi:ATP-dependent helicase/DNAse subunit B